MTSRTTHSTLPPLFSIRHPETGATVAIRRGQAGYYPVSTNCSPNTLNAGLPHPPTREKVLAMKHGIIMGWDTPSAEPTMWSRKTTAGVR